MNVKIKKLIAREGLILFSIFGIAFGYGFAAAKITGYSIEAAIRITPLFFTVGIMVLYAPYLTIRFIIWAIKTLREN